jgi:acyl carrier protein phosphodiesterase
MNFLAHIILSGDQPRVMVGNFIGDFVKGRNLAERFEPAIVTGIELHRGIDEFTDDHPVVMESKTRLRAKYRHYAPVIVDVFYDHYLAKEWSSYHPTPLETFAQQSYATLESFQAILPEDVNRMLPYMMHGNWLLNYAKIEGIQRTLTGMSRRTKFDSKMDESVNELREHYDAFQKEFERFFPQLQKFAADFLASRKH